MTNMENLPPRDSIPPENHPVRTRRYTIITPMMDKQIGEFVGWVRNGVPSGMIPGDPRIGKTKLRRTAALELPKFYPGIVIVSMIARGYVVPSERVFFGDLLRAIRHKMCTEGTAAQRRDRLTQRIVQMVRSSGQGRAVLLIDQAHKLQELHYEWLIDFHDEISEQGVELFVFLFGQKELTAISDEFRRTGKTQIIGRFMVDRLDYHGIRSLAEMKACLEAYDEHAKYPEDTDWTYTRYFFPDAYARGWRLAQHAKTFFKAFEEVRAYSPGPGRLEIPMQNFVRTVERFLLEAQVTKANEPVLSQAQIIEYVLSTAFGAAPQAGDNDEDNNEEEPMT